MAGPPTPRMKALEAKVVVLGKEGVGKTSLVVRVKLMVWDTAGQERFRSMAPMYYRKANAAFLVYDITQYSTFENMKTWVDELKTATDTPMVLCVLGNKCDLKDKRKVQSDEALMYAASIGALFFETSALTNEGVQEAFLRLSLALISLSKSAPNCGLITKDYDARRKSEDFLSFPPSLLLLREQIKEEEEKEEEEKTVGRCC